MIRVFLDIDGLSGMLIRIMMTGHILLEGG